MIMFKYLCSPDIKVFPRGGGGGAGEGGGGGGGGGGTWIVGGMADY